MSSMPSGLPGVFIHEAALCESSQIGAGTRVWAFAHILPGARIGRDCNVCDHVFIENQVVVGDRVTIKCGVQLWDGLEVGDDVFIGPNATFCNDRMPRSKCYPAAYLATRIQAGASIGANATVLPGLTIGRNAMVGAGAVVTRSVPPNAIVVGNPARIVGYVDTVDQASATAPLSPQVPAAQGGVQLFRMPLIKDMRGDLTVGEFGRSLPFTPLRYFMVMNVPSQEVRGEHAHKACEQFLVCVRGRCQVMTDDGHLRQEFTLDDPTLGLYLPPMTWGVQYRYSPDTVLLVFASHYYDADDYIRDYQRFLDEVASRAAAG
ncbi:MAG: WxcM-like domain-containing protein [Proteobacteria bacterium]|nr:WxcM-like domain-containing protein [Pseudomonadota bacterium]